ncbi:class I SAM-dependent methyltransferase [Candidatus Pacearchaeota archaeon]|nr:class I SAM-dependent methyltransferase [Candidatus Pacearchaeota archaeon]
MGEVKNTLEMRSTTDGYVDYFRYRYVAGKLNELDGKTALEVGPDDGTFAKLLVGSGFKTESLGINQRKPFPWPHHIIDIRKEYLKKTFDIILVQEVLEHLTDVEKAMENILKMGTKDTMFFIAVPNWPQSRHVRVYNAKSFKDFISGYLKIKEFRIFTNTILDTTRQQYLIVGQHI